MNHAILSTAGTLLAIAAAAGCPGAEHVTPALPVAVLACPAHIAVGETFELNGEQSIGALDASKTLLTLEPGAIAVNALVHSLAIAQAGVVTARLTVVDAALNESVAGCRIIVGDGVAPPPADPSDPTDPIVNGPVDLTGSFALITDDRPEMSGGVLDPPRQCPTSLHISLVSLEHSGTEVTMTSQVCHLTIPSVQINVLGFQSIQSYQMASATLDLLPALGPVTVQLASADSGAAFTVNGAQSAWLGANLASPLEELPQSESDGRVYDADDDEEQGITIDGTSGDENVVYRRVQRVLSGTIISSDEVDGSAEGSFRADNELSLLEFGAVAAPSSQSLDSTFTMRRIDGRDGALDLRAADGGLTCDDVRAHQSELLALYAAPDQPSDCLGFN